MADVIFTALFALDVLLRICVLRPLRPRRYSTGLLGVFERRDTGPGPVSIAGIDRKHSELVYFTYLRDEINLLV